MRARTRITWASLGSFLLGFLAAATAAAVSVDLDPLRTVVVTLRTDAVVFQSFPNKVDRLDDQPDGAVTFIRDAIARGATGSWTILVDGDGGPWPGGFTLGQDDPISIVGYPFNEPWSVVIEYGLDDEPAIRLRDVSGVVIEGVTLTSQNGDPDAGQAVGLRAEGTANATLRRCNIVSSASHGVAITGSASLTLENCCIFGNTGDGVHVANDPGQATVLEHCTIISNNLSGVRAMDDVTVAVRNCIVYDNAFGSPVAPPVQQFLLDAAPSGWLWDEQWEFGQPQGSPDTRCVECAPGTDPAVASTGDYVFGVNLRGDYTMYRVEGPFPLDDTVPVMSSVTIPGPLPVKDVNVELTLTHPAPYELSARLVGPLGSIQLFNQGAIRSDQDFSDTRLVFDAEGLDNLATAVAPFDDLRFPAVDNLEPVPGSEAQGVWTLEITDSQATHEDFADGDASGWTNRDPGEWTLNAANEFSPEEPVLEPISVYDEPTAGPWTDYEYSFEIRFPPPPVVGQDFVAGLVFRYTDDEHFYMLRVTRNATPFPGEFRLDLVKQNGPGPPEILDVGVNDGPNIPRMWFSGVVTVQGDSITVSTTMGALTYDLPNLLDPGVPYPEGTFGVMANRTVEFRNIQVIASSTTGTLNEWRLQLTPEGPRYLTTEALDFSGQTGVRMEYQQWLHTDPLTSAFVEVTTEAPPTPTWIPLPSPGDCDGTAWRLQEFVLPEEVDGESDVRVRWGYEVVDETHEPCSGWNIDDIRFSGFGSGLGGLVHEGNTGALTTAYNYVTGNGGRNYIDFPISADSVPPNPDNPGADWANPDFDPAAPWHGRLLVTSPVIDRAQPGGTVANDFEAQIRGGAPDIGADEFGDQADFGGWLFCLVAPDPAPQLPPGGLTVVVLVDGTLDVGPGPQDGDDRLYVVPMDDIQAGGPPLPHIPLDYLGDPDGNPEQGVYLFTNADPIETFLTGGNPPSPGDVIADGHARVFMYAHGRVLSEDEMLAQVKGDDATGGGGRDFLIDTIPPIQQSSVRIDEVVMLNGANTLPPYGSLGVVLETPMHPFSTIDSGIPQHNQTFLVDDYQTHAPYAPCPQNPPFGSVPEGEDSVKVFYNAGSWANNYAPQCLDAQIVVWLRDQPLAEAYPELGLEPGGVDDRQVSGFVAGSVSGTPAEVLAFAPDVFEAPLPVVWADSEGVAELPETHVTMTLNIELLPDVPNLGYFPQYENSLAASGLWTFTDPRVPLPGLPPDLPILNPDTGQGRLHLGATFGAVDRAGNAADEPGRPVDIWWLLGRDVQLDVTKTEVVGIYPQISWNLPVSHLDIPINEAPAPVYAHRIWLCSEHGVAAKNEPYEPWLVWQGWSLESEYKVITPDDFAGIENDIRIQVPPESIKDRWLLVVAAAIDPAGNVSWWPGTNPLEQSVSPEVAPTLHLDSGDTVTFENVPDTVDQGANWVRFYIPASEIDTTLSPTLFYVEPDDSRTNLGPAPIVAYPTAPGRYVLGVFDIGLVVPAVSSGEDLFARVEVEEDGQPILDDEWAPNAGLNRVRLELPGPEAPDVVFGHPDRVVNYVVRVTAQTMEGGEVKRRDPSPAHFSFKLVPGTVAGYLEGAGGDVGEQPIKQFESDVK